MPAANRRPGFAEVFGPLFDDAIKGVKVNNRETYNSLSHDKFYRLTRFIDDTKELYSGMSYQEVAAKATEHLGFNVSQTNVQTARRVLGIQIQRKSAHGQRNHDRVRVVAGAVLSLFKELGLDAPEELQKIWRKQA